MFRSVNFVVLAGAVVLVSWGIKGKNEHAAAARADAISTYRLNTQQAKVYDECLDAMSRKRLKNGGSNESFCGCFANAAADDDVGLKYSTRILRQAVAGFSTDSAAVTNASATPADAQYFPAFLKTLTTAVACIKDQQHTFASNDERNAWCAAKPERASDRRCRPL